MEFIKASAFEALDASLLSSEITEADSCTVVGISVLNHGTQKQKIPGELTERRDAPKLEKLFACRGSSLVERRPEKAGVASSILAPGTTRSRHRFVPEEIYFAVSKIRGFPSLRDGFERECTEVFREHRPSLVDALWMRD